MKTRKPSRSRRVRASCTPLASIVRVTTSPAGVPKHWERGHRKVAAVAHGGVLNAYVGRDELDTQLERYVVAPHFEQDAGLMGAFALAERALR